MIESELSEGLSRIADTAGPPAINAAVLVGRVRRRRRLRAASKGSVVLAACASVAVVGVPWLASSGGRTEAKTLLPSAGGSASPTTSAARLRGYACGDPVGSGAQASNRQGSMTVEISGVRRTADGPPQVTYTVRSDRTVHLVRDPGTPRVLVLRDGRVVAGQDLTARELAALPRVNSDKVARAVTIDPAHPYVAALPPVMGSPCSGRSWDELWAKGGGYEIALVVNARGLTDVGVDPQLPDPEQVLLLRLPLAH